MPGGTEARWEDEAERDSDTDADGDVVALVVAVAARVADVDAEALELAEPDSDFEAAVDWLAVTEGEVLKLPEPVSVCVTDGDGGVLLDGDVDAERVLLADEDVGEPTQYT